MSEAAIDRSEFYDAIFKASGTRYFLGSRVYDEGDITVFHSVEFDHAHGHPEKNKIDVFARTSRNLGKAWKLAKTQATLPGSDMDGFVFAHLPWAIFSVNQNGHVATENENAENFVFGGGPMSLVEGWLLTSSSAVNTIISNFVKRAISGHSGSIALPTQTSPIPLILQSLPVPGKPSAFLFIRDPRQSSALYEHVLPELFGLTVAEIRIINVLVAGKDLQAVAEELSISRNTVRNHLQNIFQKTKTQNRAELLVQVLGLIDP